MTMMFPFFDYLYYKSCQFTTGMENQVQELVVLPLSLCYKHLIYSQFYFALNYLLM